MKFRFNGPNWNPGEAEFAAFAALMFGTVLLIIAKAFWGFGPFAHHLIP